MKRSNLILAALLACSVPSCLPTNQSTTGGSAYTGANKFGYRGSETDPAGFQSKPSPAPDGEMARAMNPGAPAGAIQKEVGPSAAPSGVAGSTISQPVLPTINSTPPRPPDTGINPQSVKTSPPPPPPPTQPQVVTGSTSTPPPPPGTTGASTAAATTKAKSDYPYGIPVPGKEGMVYSPYDKEAGYVDVRGMKPGALVEDPYSKKYFRVP